MTFLDHLSRTARGRSLTVSRPLVLAGVAVLSLAPLVGAAPSSAAPSSAAPAARPPAISLFSGSGNFRVGGHTWTLSVSTLGGITGIDLSTTHELDTWSFLSVPQSDLKANVRTGRATFNAHNSMAPVAFANLKFTPTSRHQGSCRSGSVTLFDGKVTGSVSLAARKGLKFRSGHVSFKGAALTIDHNCTPRTGVGPCLSGTWDVGSTAAVIGNTAGLPGRQTFFADLVKTVTLKAPKHASVTFEVAGSAQKPVFDSKHRRLSVKATRLVKGSAVLVASGPSSVLNSNCSIGRKHFKERNVSYFGTFSSPRGGQFHARSLVGGNLAVPRSGTAFFDIVSVKRA